MMEALMDRETETQAPLLFNGTYTVTVPDRGHFTIRVHTAQDGKLKGRRIISMLTGSDNEGDYTGLAFWNDDRGSAQVWKKHRSAGTCPSFNGSTWDRAWNKTERKLAVFLDLALHSNGGHWYAKGCRLFEEKRCLMCNRKLTTPESIESGIGPVCAHRRGN